VSALLEPNPGEMRDRRPLFTTIDVRGSCMRAHRLADGDGATAGAATAGTLTAVAEPMNTMHGVCEHRGMLT
jgi:hypothetical protein